MKLIELEQQLGYENATGYLKGVNLFSVPDIGHVFRKASRSIDEGGCSLHGVYGIQTLPGKKNSPVNPVVYLCKATSECEADEIHRLVWNQDVVPFLIVLTKKNVRLYKGQDYVSEKAGSGKRGIIYSNIEFDRVTEQLEKLRSYEIDSGNVWRSFDRVERSRRVHKRLLENLRELEIRLREMKLSRELSHLLIGKYVYLKYLRDRGILSDRKMAKWGVTPDQIFGRDAEKEAFKTVLHELDDDLNGSIFPFDPDQVRIDQLQLTAGVFAGDETGGQLHLDFQAYDFSFIPIETLSTIYQDFLHSVDANANESKGKEAGAYYTPVPLANFMIEEMNDHLPLREGMRVLDPSCGSGVFLVQIYRRLIESKAKKERLTPVLLREILTKHIFGIERDEDACRITGLSLILTLLDYVNPPDLENTRFKLPNLYNQNIFHVDFFLSQPLLSDRKFHWIIGNPPWVELKTGKVDDRDLPAWRWLGENAEFQPTGGNQIAEAFAHLVTQYSTEKGIIGLLLPAMTLFKTESREFRKSLFSRVRLLSVANLSNARRELFEKAIAPPAVLFYSPHPEIDPESESLSANRFHVWSPIVAAQSFLKKTTWQIAINAEELKELDQSQVQSGESLPWKVAMWGSPYDQRLLTSIGKRFETLAEFAKENELVISQGMELRHKDSKEKIDPLPEVIGKHKLDFSKLKNSGRIFSFPDESIVEVEPEEAFCRKGRGKLPLSVSKPPHVIVQVSRRFSVFSDNFIIVPPRQIGISGPEEKTNILKAICIYLNSNIALYHQFYFSPQWGIYIPISTLDTLEGLPIPLSKLSEKEIRHLADLHDRIVLADREEREKGNSGPDLFSKKSSGKRENLHDLLSEVNQYFYKLLGLKVWQQALVEDLVLEKLKAADNAVPDNLILPPTEQEIKQYGELLKSTLDDYLNSAGIRKYHEISVVHDQESGMVQISKTENPNSARRIVVTEASGKTGETFLRMRSVIRKEYSQWVYIDRNLKIYEKDTIYLFKPFKRQSWLRSKALEDFSSLLGQILSDGRQG